MLNKNKFRKSPKGNKANLFFIVKNFKELEFIIDFDHYKGFTDEQIDEAVKNYSLQTKISVNDIVKRIGKGPFAAQIASNNAIQLILESKVVE